METNKYFTRSRSEMLAFLPQEFNNVLEIGIILQEKKKEGLFLRV